MTARRLLTVAEVMGGMRGGVAVLGAVLALACVTAAAVPPDPVAPLVCRRVKRLRPPLATPDTSVVPGDGTAVEVHDRYDAGSRATSVNLRRMRVLCLPASDGPAPASDAAMAAFGVRPLPGARPRPIDVDHTVETVVGETTINVRAIERLMVSADTAPAGQRPDGFDPSTATQHTCYDVRPEGKTARHRLDLVTGDDTWALKTVRPRRLCIPAGIRTDASRPDYMCFEAKLRRRAASPPRIARESTSVFGRERLRLGEVREVCLPSATELPPPPPEPGFELEIDPPVREVEWRDRASYRAIARWDDGRVQDLTEQVEWASADERFAAPALDEDGVFRAREPGDVTVRATEPTTGKVATATLDVRWSLERIELSPQQVNRAIGQHEDYQATGWFAGGVSHNVTDRLTYATSDESVAVPSNDADTPSRVEPVRHGTVKVSACDIRSGLCAADATMIVLGGLQSIELGPQTEIAVGTGEFLPLTAIGRYADGRQKNLTQKVEWRVANPAVAEPGEHGVLIGLAPGRTTVTAIDPKTGLESVSRSVTVLGAMKGVVVYANMASPMDQMRAGDSHRLTARAVYEGGGSTNVTQRVEWTSLTPAVVAAPNDDGDRSRVDAVGPGVGRVIARDPRSGLTSGEAQVPVLGPLVDLVASSRRTDMNPIPLGGAAWVQLAGRFFPAYGLWSQLNFHQYRPADDYEMISTDPSVLRPAGRGSVAGVAPGHASVYFRDRATGVTSNQVSFTVKGAMERITLEPARITRAIGEREELLALGRHQPNLTTLLTQQLVYTSSDERVAIATNEAGHKSRILAVGPGTATISAVDPVSGLRTTDGGGDAVITVLPGAIERITISPPVRLLPTGGFEDFTATGHYADGRTINVTSQVTWRSSATTVAYTRDDCPDCYGYPWSRDDISRSRVRGVAPGTVFVTAIHPTGVTSSDSGHDAIVIVEDVVRLDLLPPDATIDVGDIQSYRTRALLAGGQTLDVTDQAQYWTDDPGVAWNVELPDAGWEEQRSVNEIEARAPGTVAVHSTLSLGHAQGDATLTVIVPTTTVTTTTTSTTLPGGATLALDPPVRIVDFGEPVSFRAVIGTVDVTERAEWSVVDGTIASGDDGVFTTHDPGTTTVTARDPVSGMQASATLTVGFTLRSIRVLPNFAVRSVGGRVRFQAIGEFAGGRTVDLSERVSFAVSDGAIAAVDMDAEHAGEVVALADGDTEVVACELRSAICTSGGRNGALSVDSSGDRYVVGRVLDGDPLMPGRKRDVRVQLVHTTWFGSAYEDIDPALVTWTDLTPSVARLVREGPTGFRVYGLAPGQAEFLLAHDGAGSGYFYANVLGPLTSLHAWVAHPFEVGKTGGAGAWGTDASGAYRNMTFDAEYRSLDPDIVATPNEPGHPNRLVGVAPGTGRIVARDPATGVESAPASVLVYGRLARIDTLPNDGEGNATPWLGVGATFSLRARGIYEGGYTRCMACRSPVRPVRFVSSDPSVLEVGDTWGEWTEVRAVRLGEAVVTAVDVETGISGVGQTFFVVGNLARLELRPAPSVVRGIGEHEWVTTIGHYPPRQTSNLTQWVRYESSDESVAVVSNEWGTRGEITTVGPGTAVISARAFGLSSTTSGDDLTVTVLPGTLERIVVSPAFARRMVGDAEEFTAVGYYPDGTSLNVTQQVEWQIGSSSVAGAFGPPNRRSLIEGVGPGTTTITAVHPSGVSSADSGESATMEVDAIVALHVEPGPRTLVPGQAEELTVTAELASGESRNVTQLAEYGAWPLAPVVLSVPSVAPRKSRFEAVAPGDAEVVVSFGGQTARVSIAVVGGP